jgi:NitT/TauT family transport system substrate-binding protein
MRAVALILALLAATFVPGRAATNDVVRLGLNPTVLAYLPVLVAMDRGYFTAQHIDIQLKPNSGSSMLQLPLLARGDLDIAPMVLAPAFLNQLNEGFNVKLIVAGQSSHAGWNDNSWIVVRQDVWDSGAVRKPADLKGKVVDGTSPGGPPDLLMKSLIAAAHLTIADMTFTEKLRGGPDVVASLHNHGVDVVAAFEPGASVLQIQHLAHKWMSVHDVIPWLQETFLAASGAFLKDHPDVATRFLVAYLEGARDVARSNGHWTPQLLATLSKYSGIAVADLQQVPGPAYVDPLGSINNISIDRQQEFYLSEHLIAKPLAFADMVATGPLFAARRALANATPRR